MTIKFKTDNAAFEDDFSGEVAVILTNIIHKVQQGYTSGNIYDSNGNRIGYWSN